MKYSDLVKKHIEKLYDGVCTIMYYEKKQGIINNTILAIKAENVKCRLSYKSDKNSEQTDKTNRKRCKSVTNNKAVFATRY